MSAMQVKVRQSGCKLVDLTENEMFWKVHWSWQSGPRAAISDDSALETPMPTGRKDPYVQSLEDQNASLKKQLNGKGKGKNDFARRTGRRGGGGKAKNDQGGFHQEDGQRVPPPPAPVGDRGQSAGARAWAKRARKGTGRR